MPQASDELRAKFDGPEEAWKKLELFCVNIEGVIRPKSEVDEQIVRADVDLQDAIEYLWREWDYGYLPYPPNEHEEATPKRSTP